MCGILGIATITGRALDTSDQAVARLRDLMAHRGPDGAGVWRTSNLILAHRRLAVIDPTPAGAQPFLSADGRYALIYNGELYNDHDLRRELAAAGISFRSSCDTETVLHALAHWGAAALARFRGMFALAFYDTHTRVLLLARDPLGIKPLYFWLRDGANPLALFASEPTPILAHPEVSVRPDLVTVSAYLTTIRTVLGNRTLFEGVRTLRPGEALEINLAGSEMQCALLRHWTGAPAGPAVPLQDAASRTLQTLREAVTLHRRSDVPTCALLSGGLDSSAIVSLLAEHRGSPGAERGWSHRTYCSGAAPALDEPASDFAFARCAARAFDTTHTEAPVSRELFGVRWREMVARLGVPLSTPNEVAINEVARRLRADGQVVALSGEGADELFAGYDIPMSEALAFEAQHPAGLTGGAHQLAANAWMPPELKATALSPEAWRIAEHDSHLHAFYTDEFESLRAECGDLASPLDAHLRFHRRINLAGLLQRLDTATMLESVEGRTPFADRAVAELAESLPMDAKFQPSQNGLPALTKLALRTAFLDRLPAEIVQRPKASFPLPFQEWVADQGGALRRSALAREIFSPAALQLVAADPARHWRVAWPMINIALWGQRWWGE